MSKTVIETIHEMAAAEMDIVEALTSLDAVDYVQRIYGSGHDRYCDYKPSVTADGMIWCDTCLSQIGSIHPERWDVPFAERQDGFDPFGPGLKIRRHQTRELMGKEARRADELEAQERRQREREKARAKG